MACFLKLGSFLQLAVTTGLLMSQILGLDTILGTESEWPVLLGIAGIPALIQIMLMPFMPESPRFLVINKNEDQAGRQALERLRGSASKNEIDTEFEEVSTIIRAKQNLLLNKIERWIIIKKL